MSIINNPQELGGIALFALKTPIALPDESQSKAKLLQRTESPIANAAVNFMGLE